MNKNNKTRPTILALGGMGNRLLKELSLKKEDKEFFNIIKIDNYKEEILNLNKLKIRLNDSKKLLIITGLGGYFMKLAAAKICKMANSNNIDIHIFMTMPFIWEGTRRNNIALIAKREILKYTKNIQIYDNQKIRTKNLRFQHMDGNEKLVDVDKNKLLNLLNEDIGSRRSLTIKTMNNLLYKRAKVFFKNYKNSCIE